MVKTPRTRHSKSTREPVTIDLDPDAVKRVDEATVETPQEPFASESASPPVDETPTGDAAPVDADATPETQPSPEPSGYDFSEPSVSDAPVQEPAAEISEPPVEETVAEQSAYRAAPRPEPAPRRKGGSSLMAGVAGAAIALAVAAGLQYSGLLAAPTGSGDSTQVAALQSELDAVKQQLAALSNAPSAPGDAGALDQLRSELAALKSEVESGGAADSGGLAALDERLKSIESSVAAASENTASQDEITALNERITGLDATLKSATDGTSAIEGRIGALEQTISGLTEKVDAQADQPRIALAIAAAALKSAVDRGEPFGAELETLAAIAPDAPELAALRGFAEKGVPSRADILAQTDAAATAMIAAGSPIDANAGYFDQLMASAKSMVQVRPIGAVEGTGVPETVARIEAAVNEGNYEKALAEYEALPDAVKAAGADFTAKLKARLEVEKLADQLVAGAMKA
ncbi:phage tail protein [Oryzicola mucosus]|uniref:Phage tail protein n=1 Tax=Oryzicola mucosus TaxID=2767425 RepID=A0A8J6Q0H5_9HYPH|nr:phage tail protein [Oryzicola mucosus]MBD0413945.1 phage tail protein [Oryzicola mucosus]